MCACVCVRLSLFVLHAHGLHALLSTRLPLTRVHTSYVLCDCSRHLFFSVRARRSHDALCIEGPASVSILLIVLRLFASCILQLINKVLHHFTLCICMFACPPVSLDSLPLHHRRLYLVPRPLYLLIIILLYRISLSVSCHG